MALMQQIGSPSARDRRLLGEVWAVAALYVVVCAAAGWLGYAQTRIPWELFQLLDREALASAPLTSLLLLHHQPPLLNALAAALLWLGQATGSSPEGLATELFFLVGLLATICTYAAVKGLTGSRFWAALAITALLLDPGFHLFRTMFFYPWLVQAAMAGLLLAAFHYARGGRAGSLWAVVVLLGLVVNTRSLFHPLWAAGFFVLLLLAARRSAPGGGPRLKSLAPAVLVLALLLTAWPLKNQVVFGQFTFSSLTGFNLSRDLPVDRDQLKRYLFKARVPAASQERADGFVHQYGQGAGRVVSAASKSTGQRNWNHLLMLELNPTLARAGLQWRGDNPGAWANRAAFFYRCWSLSTFLNPYGLDPMGPQTPRFRAYQGLWSAAFYADLKPVGRLLVDATGAARAGKTPYPYTVFGFVLLPALLLLSVGLIMRRGSRRRPEGGALLLCLYCLAWVLVVPCLTDGFEGNRMRFGVGPMQLALSCCLLAWLSGWVRRLGILQRKRPSPPGRGSPG